MKLLLYPIEFLVFLAFFLFGFAIYKRLVKSTTFKHIVEETVSPPEDQDEAEVAILHIDQSNNKARELAERQERESMERSQAASRLRRKLQPED